MMPIARNIQIHNLSNDLMDLGMDMCKENGLNPEEYKRFWGLVVESAKQLVGTPKTEKKEKKKSKPPSRPSQRLNDNDRMPWGKHEGENLGDVPRDYWRWFLSQDWCDKWPDLVEYASLSVEDGDNIVSSNDSFADDFKYDEDDIPF